MNIVNEIDVTEHREAGRGKRLIWGLMLVVLAVGLLVMLSGCSHHSRHHGGMEHGELANPEKLAKHMGYALNYIDASDEQQASIKPIVDEAIPLFKKHQSETRQLKLRLAALLKAEALDHQQLDVIIDEGEQLSRKAYRDAMTVMVTLASELNAEQREILIQKWQDRLE